MQTIFSHGLWECIFTFFNSSFTTSLLGSLAGAFAGAWIAQHIIERAKEKESLTSQIRATNAAITATLSACNLFIALKRQRINVLYDTYSHKLLEFKKFQALIADGLIQENETLNIKMDLTTTEAPVFPTEIIQKYNLEKLPLEGRPLSLTIALTNSITTTGSLLKKHTALSRTIRDWPENDQKGKLALYFGTETNSGNTNTEYGDTIQGIKDEINHGIYFSQLLCKDLIQIGNNALEKLKKLDKNTKEKICSINLEPAIKLGLIPDDESYQDWLKGFPTNIEAE